MSVSAGVRVCVVLAHLVGLEEITLRCRCDSVKPSRLPVLANIESNCYMIHFELAALRIRGGRSNVLGGLTLGAEEAGRGIQ